MLQFSCMERHKAERVRAEVASAVHAGKRGRNYKDRVDGAVVLGPWGATGTQMAFMSVRRTETLVPNAWGTIYMTTEIYPTTQNLPR